MTTSSTTEADQQTTQAFYVYGIVPGSATVPDLEESATMSDGPRVLADGPVGAVVEAIDPDRPLGRRRDLVAHSTVLNAVALEGPVLPMRFGSVVHDEAAVVEELLRPNREHFLDLLEQVSGKVQLNLRARSELDTVLAEVVSGNREVAELRRRTADLPEDATHYERIRLGELVAHEVDARRQRDAQVVLDVLAPHALDHVVRDSSGMDAVTEVAFLVPADDHSALEQAAEALAEEMAGRVRLSLLGPLALYDFVQEQ